MGDYPDFTDIMQIVGSDIQVPIDIQGAYIQLPVDIQAQYITLDIDIVAQTVGNLTIDIAAQTVGNIAVNLAASAITLDINIKTSAITLNVDITAQTVGNINFDIKAQSVAIQLQADWQAVQGNQKYFRAYDASTVFADWATGNYVVPANKTLYITHFGGTCYAAAVADADKEQMCRMQIWNSTDTEFLGERGGNGGGGMVLTTPAKIVAGKNFRYQIQCLANHTCSIYITVGGYEI